MKREGSAVSEGIEHGLRRILLPQPAGTGEAIAIEKPAIHALFVRLDMPHLPAVGAFPLRGLGLASWVGGDRGGRVAGDRGRHAAEGGCGTGAGGCSGGDRGGGVDAFGLFALVPAFAVFFQAGELVRDSMVGSLVSALGETEWGG